MGCNHATALLRRKHRIAVNNDGDMWIGVEVDEVMIIREAGPTKDGV